MISRISYALLAVVLSFSLLTMELELSICQDRGTLTFTSLTNCTR